MAKKILVIDDDVQYVDTIKTLLEGSGYEVNVSYKGKDGFEIAKKDKPDLVLLDVMFAGPQGPDGFELSRSFHDTPETKDIPVIIVTGITKFFNLGFTYQPDDQWAPVKAIIEKPVTPEKILQEIKKIIG